MAVYSGYLLIGLPDNSQANQLIVASGVSSSGVFTDISTFDYVYPTRTQPYSIDEDSWYKISFNDTASDWQSPYSNAIDGAQILRAVPQLSIGSSYDGVSYSTPQDIYDRSNLTEADVPYSDVSYSLNIAKSYIDIRMSTVSPGRFGVNDADVAKRKYNALLRLLKDVEINFALSLIYRNMADDKIIENVTGNTKTSSSISVGQTSIGGISGPDTVDTASYLDSLSTRYANYAIGLLNTLTPNYVPLRYSESGTGNTLSFIRYATNNAPYFNFADGIILDRMDL